jgi:hypothetical protein
LPVVAYVITLTIFIMTSCILGIVFSCKRQLYCSTTSVPYNDLVICDKFSIFCCTLPSDFQVRNETVILYDQTVNLGMQSLSNDALQLALRDRVVAAAGNDTAALDSWGSVPFVRASSGFSGLVPTVINVGAEIFT